MSDDPRDVDVLILGAGINGAGLFRDLCEQGLACVIVDKADFGSGTSAAPSRLIHGGIKYLETGEFRLVAQSTLERNLLLRNAPHYVEPLPTVIPIFSWMKGIPAALRTLFGSTTAPRSRGALLVKIGLAMYDFYGARQRVMPRHALWSRSRALREIAPLTPRIVAAGTYFDANITHPERLVLELLQDGMAASPLSSAMNYTTLASVDGASLRFSGPDNRTHRFRPRIVINAAGPWIDRVNAQLGAPSKLVGGTKGSHILLDHTDLLKALGGRMLYFEADDGRICLVFDFLGKALVGSSDIRADDPDNVRCDDDEIDYFLASLRSLLPGLAFDRSQIVYTYSGIRPLPASDAANPGLISRDHSAPVIEPSRHHPWPIVSLVGGKWTTFRGFAEEVTDLVLDRLGQPRRVSTRGLPIGGRDFPKDAEARARWIAQTARETGATHTRTEALLRRYGTTGRKVLAAEALAPARYLPGTKDYSFAEIDWIARNEQVVHVEDIVMRRTSLAITGHLTPGDIALISEILAAIHAWDDSIRASESSATIAVLRNNHDCAM